MQEPNYNTPIPPPGGGQYSSGPVGSGQPNGVLILILGILGICVCGFCAPVAWIMGNNALAEIDSGRGDPTQRQNANVGRILGMVGSILIICGILFYVLIVILAIATGGMRR